MISASLAESGLNLQAVFAIQDLPEDIQRSLSTSTTDLSAFTQLILLAHGGRLLWNQLSQFNAQSTDPVDEYSRIQVERFFQQEAPNAHFDVVYPGPHPVQLQHLGELAGWHFRSPFMVGINDVWGSWYAYRALVLADTQFPLTRSKISQSRHPQSPCGSCESKPCLSACPVNAVSEAGLDMGLCVSYRKVENSKCQSTCLARLACPVGAEHRYTEAQIRYHYQTSLDTIKKYY